MTVKLNNRWSKPWLPSAVLRTLLFVAVLVAVVGGVAAFGPRAQDFDTVAVGDPIAVRLERLSDLDLKRYYLRCSQAARNELGSGGIALCSIGYELLLQRAFGGDFYALLAWSREQSGDSATAGRQWGGLTESAGTRNRIARHGE